LRLIIDVKWNFYCGTEGLKVLALHELGRKKHLTSGPTASLELPRIPKKEPPKAGPEHRRVEIWIVGDVVLKILNPVEFPC
jgi:hypothetical protein